MASIAFTQWKRESLQIRFPPPVHQSVLTAKVMSEGSDVEVTADVIEKAQEWYRALASCSSDEGHHSPANQ